MEIARLDGRDQIRNVMIHMWDQELFSARAVTALDGAVQAELSISGEDLGGKIRNGSSLELRQAALLCRGRAKSLGDIGAGQVVELTDPLRVPPPSLPPAPPTPGSSPPMVHGPRHEGGTQAGRDAFNQLQYTIGSPTSGLDPQATVIRNKLLEGLFQRGAPVFSDDEAILVAWADSSPLAINVSGRNAKRVGQTLLLVHIPVSGGG